ncbi:hypothetical protein [Actinoplanes friuliensis]|jgi:hypothetical protein|uniref:Uncharacterized protein n=1 Tax=Actinoplanes friuliensis DSM 7358 TaxID=1246995 RepID=U5W1A6_9ACTN|nr:hypothetical protein [Actinoplanes friuliensis]AGZ43033.1 hypothetical protein AFR_23825 [Actinoplanes friuliensis DSM 7358]
MHDSAYEVAGDDPRLAKLLRVSLTKLAEGDDPLLREMAEGVLDGSVDLRRAAMSDAYDAGFDAAFSQFRDHYDSLDQDQREELAAETERQLDSLLDD